MVDAGARVSAHVDRGGAGTIVRRAVAYLASRARRGGTHLVEVETQYHADVEQGLIADRSSRQQVLDGLFVNVGCVRKLGLGHLLLDHRRLDEREYRLFAIAVHWA